VPAAVPAEEVRQELAETASAEVKSEVQAPTPLATSVETL
jgi:hypothetical protein